MKYEALTTPFKIGNVEIRNRFVMLPMTIEKTDNYAIGDDLIDFYEQRAIGGAGLIEIGSCYVCDCFDTHPKYHTTTGACGVWDDCFIPGLTRTAEACHKHGAKLAAQLQLCYEWRPDGNTELLSYAPSKDVVSGPFVGMPEREFTIDEIKLVVKQYGEAAKRCQKAGIDIIEIHAGIGYMVMRFISKYSNHRTDEYGGSTENRCRLLTDIIDEIHRVCGEDYPILIRYSADDLMPGGQRLEDLKEVIEVVEKHGVDAWSIQAGFHEAPRPVANQLVPEGEFIYLSKAAKQYTKLPTFPGTRINHLDVCEKIIEDGSGDAVGMARHWIAEPEIGDNSYAPDWATEDDLLFLTEYLTDPKPENRARAEHLCAMNPARPWQVIAITFTNKAARELRERLEFALGDEEAASAVWAYTFHTACLRILRKHVDLLGFESAFTIYDEDDKKRVILNVMKKLDLDPKNFDPRTVMGMISRA